MKVAHRGALAVLASAVLLLSIGASGAGATPARSQDLCSVAKAVASSLVKPPSAATLTAAQAQANLKSTLDRLASVRGALVAATPGSLKADMKRVVAVYMLLRADLAKVHYSFVGLAARPTLLTSLNAASNRAKPSFAHLETYFHGTCHLG